MDFDAFISYSHNDKPAADAACAKLEGQGVRCWIAPRDIRAGGEYGAAIVDAIDHCRVMILIFSSSANESPQILREIERAVSRGVPVVPLRIEAVSPTKSMAYFLGAIHWLDAFALPLDRHLQQLAETVGAMIAASNASGSTPSDDGARRKTASAAEVQSAARADTRVEAPTTASRSTPATLAQPAEASKTNWILPAAAVFVGVVVLAAAFAYLAVIQFKPTEPAAMLQSGVYDYVGNKHPATATITVNGSSFTGTASFRCCPSLRTDPLEGSFSTANKTITFTRDCTGQGATGPCMQVYTGALGHNSAFGTFTHNGTGSLPWSMQKR
jgi:hypothetical protein